MTTRKQYTKEFKQDAVRLVTEQGYRQREAARNLGIDRGMLGRWVKELQEDGSDAFRGNGRLTADIGELHRTYLHPLAWTQRLLCVVLPLHSYSAWAGVIYCDMAQ